MNILDEIIMNDNINTLQLPDKPTDYEQKLAQARTLLNGGAYCKDVHALVPNYSQHAIRNIVNGRGRNELVLTALLIVVGKRAKKAQLEQLRLQKAARQAGVLAGLKNICS